MSNNDYKIDYNDASSGINTLNKTSEGINEIVDKTDRNMNSTFDTELFSGPLSNYCQNTWNAIKTVAQANSKNISTSGRSLNNISEVYQKSDQEVGESVGKV